MTATLDTTRRDRLDEAYDRLLAPPPPLPATFPAEWLANGFYTLTFPSGEHRTFRVRTERTGMHRGKRTLALLIGPDNTDEYESFAFIAADGSGFDVWKRFRGPADGSRPTKHEQHAAILFDLASGRKLDGYEILVSRRCFRCNRPLTTPESIRTGYGPECSARRTGGSR